MIFVEVGPYTHAQALSQARPGPADLHKNQLFIEKHCFTYILIISGPSRPQKWIRLEILR